MRRSLKIKTISMLLAWMIIFLHGIIPHIHHEHRSLNCHQIWHFNHVPSTMEKTNNEGIIMLSAAGNNHSEVLICHFSTELMHETHLDYLFINEATGSYISAPFKPGNYMHYQTTNRIIKTVLKFMPLRAPPFSCIAPC